MNTPAERMAAFQVRAAEAAASWYAPSGEWRLASKPPLTRERYWICFALYATGRAALADAVIKAGPLERFGDHEFGIFETNIAVLLLVRHACRMAADARLKLEGLARDGFSFLPGNRQPDYQFHGYNDNMPAKATMGLILGGELLGNAAAVEHGVHNLRQLRAMLVRRGIQSEYHSATYTPLTIHALSEIAAHARSEEARALARGCEERLWIDVAARFHPETRMAAGPMSRAYTVDTLGHLTCLSSLLWFVLGEAAEPSPLALFDGSDDLVLHHGGDRPFNVAQMAWFTAGNYHVPEAAAKLFARKEYPFRAGATFEAGDAGPDFPARAGRIQTWQAADYTVSSADAGWLQGHQTLSYFATYRRGLMVGSIRDRGTVFTKWLANDDLPGRVEKSADACEGEADLNQNVSCTVTLQEGPTVLVLTQPHLELGGSADGKKPAAPLHALRELVLFPSHFFGADEIMVGGQTRREWGGNLAHGEWLCCRRGRMYIGIRPLVYGNPGRAVKTALVKHGPYEALETVFHEGGETTFTRDELRRRFGGFVAEHASVADYPSLAAFASACAAARLSDWYWTTRRVRYRRPEARGRAALELEISLSPGSVEPRFAAVDGRCRRPGPVEIDGVDASTLPFLGEPFRPLPGYFPWEKLETAWGPQASGIGDRETDG